MPRKLLRLIASTALSASIAGTAFAASPVPLTEQQMDKVTAGGNPWTTMSLASLYQIVYGPLFQNQYRPAAPATTPVNSAPTPSYVPPPVPVSGGALSGGAQSWQAKNDSILAQAAFFESKPTSYYVPAHPTANDFLAVNMAGGYRTVIVPYGFAPNR